MIEKFFSDHWDKIIAAVLMLISVTVLILVIFLCLGGEAAEKRTDFDTAMIIDAGIYKTDIVWYTIEGEWVTICTKTEPFDEITYRIHQSNVVLIRQEVAP